MKEISPESMDTNTPIKNNNSWYSLVNISFLFLVIGSVLFLYFSSLNSPSRSLVISNSLESPLVDKSAWQVPKDELEEILSKASLGNKTVIIAVVNKAYVESNTFPNMLDLFLEGFWSGEGTRELINHLIIVAVDQTAYERCIFRGLHCYRLKTDGVDFMGEKVYMSDDFIKMMWQRTLFLIDVLKRGYNFIFTDTDVMWLRNPFTILKSNGTHDLDLQFSVDVHNGNSTSPLNSINTGFYFVKSSNKTITLFEKWYGFKNNSTGQKEQDVLQNMIRQGVINELRLEVRFLQTRFFSGFCEDSHDIGSVVTVHANCCRFISAKVADLTSVLHQWERSRGLMNNKTTLFRWSKHVECEKSWKENNRVD